MACFTVKEHGAIRVPKRTGANPKSAAKVSVIIRNASIIATNFEEISHFLEIPFPCLAVLGSVLHDAPGLATTTQQMKTTKHSISWSQQLLLICD